MNALSPQDDEIIHEARHTTCHALLFKVKQEGIEIGCWRCKDPVLFTWQQVLILMLAAVVGKPVDIERE